MLRDVSRSGSIIRRLKIGRYQLKQADAPFGEGVASTVTAGYETRGMSNKDMRHEVLRKTARSHKAQEFLDGHKGATGHSLAESMTEHLTDDRKNDISKKRNQILQELYVTKGTNTLTKEEVDEYVRKMDNEQVLINLRREKFEAEQIKEETKRGQF